MFLFFQLIYYYNESAVTFVPVTTDIFDLRSISFKNTSNLYRKYKLFSHYYDFYESLSGESGLYLIGLIDFYFIFIFV